MVKREGSVYRCTSVTLSHRSGRKMDKSEHIFSHLETVQTWVLVFTWMFIYSRILYILFAIHDFHLEVSTLSALRKGCC